MDPNQNPRQVVRHTLPPVVLHPYQAKIIAAILSDKPLTICLGRKCGVTYAERIAKQIKAEMDKLQNPTVEGRTAKGQDT